MEMLDKLVSDQIVAKHRREIVEVGKLSEYRTAHAQYVAHSRHIAVQVSGPCINRAAFVSLVVELTSLRIRASLLWDSLFVKLAHTLGLRGVRASRTVCSKTSAHR
jgi:hypothetical protein